MCTKKKEEWHCLVCGKTKEDGCNHCEECGAVLDEHGACKCEDWVDAGLSYDDE